MISLEELKLIKNENIVNRFLSQFTFTKDEADDIFEETKKWLWLCAKKDYDKKNNLLLNIPNSLVLDEQTQIIDEMWHIFILFTKDYEEFCLKNLGLFIHHYPKTSNHKKLNLDLFYKNQFNYIYDNLGKDTLLKWYEEYPSKYSLDVISKKFKYLKDV